MKIDILINVVSDALDANQAYLAFCRELRTKRGLLPNGAVKKHRQSRRDRPKKGGLCIVVKKRVQKSKPWKKRQKSGKIWQKIKRQAAWLGT